MIVQCPYCATRFELDPARLSAPNPMLKCSRCRHIFPAPASKAASAPRSSSRTKPARPSEENLTLPFDGDNWKETADARPGAGFDISEPEEAFTLGVDDAPDELVMPEAEADEFDATATTAPVEVPPEEDDLEAPPTDAYADELPVAPAAEEVAPPVIPPRRAATRTRARASGTGSMPLRPLFIFFAVVVGVYGFVARSLLANPTLTDQFMGQLPIVGRLGNEQLLVRKIALSDVTGTYQRIRDGKTVFVISGRATNTAPVPLHGVQVTGKLIDGDGTVLDEKVISCGNVISAKVLKDLTPQEVSILQKLNPPQRFTINPGESSTFVIVFMEPPDHAVEFTAQAVAAHRQA